MTNWIKVTPWSLPRLHSQVLAVGRVNIRGDLGQFVAILKRLGPELWTDECGYERKVVYWMPLPDMPVQCTDNLAREGPGVDQDSFCSTPDQWPSQDGWDAW